MKIIAYHATNFEITGLFYEFLVRNRVNHKNGPLGYGVGLNQIGFNLLVVA